MKKSKITIQASINAPIEKVWEYYTQPEHIVKWNFADPSWHCLSAENDMQVGGIYKARMEAKDASNGFDFEAVYTEIVEKERFSYTFWDRTATVTFQNLSAQTLVTVTFDPEDENPVDMQQAGWQMILNNFKSYTEAS